MVGLLNSEFDDGDTPFTENSVKLILSLACGELFHIEIMDELMVELYGDSPPISMRTVKELFIIASGDVEMLSAITDLNAQAQGALIHTEDNEEESILKTIELDPEGFSMQFLM